MRYIHTQRNEEECDYIYVSLLSETSMRERFLVRQASIILGFGVAFAFPTSIDADPNRPFCPDFGVWASGVAAQDPFSSFRSSGTPPLRCL